ncbi:unnamed protein product [Diamesa tonsa]
MKRIVVLLVFASLNVIANCKIDVYHVSEKLDNKLESFRFPTLPPWFPTGLPTGILTGFPTGFPTAFPTGLPTTFPPSVPAEEDKDKEQEIIDDKDDKDNVIKDISDPEKDSDNEIDSGKCPESGVELMQHKSECGKYILCFGGVRIVRNCAPGLHFSSKLQSCTRPEFSECIVEQQTVCPLENDPENLVYIPDYNDCSKYSLCFDGKPIPFNCAEGFHWNAQQEWCMAKEEAMCFYDSLIPVETFACPIKTGTSYFPHESDCGSFYRCVNGVHEMLQCADGLLWSQQLGILFDDGNEINLDGLINKEGYLEAQNVEFRYFYSPCSNSKILPDVNKNTTDNCIGGTGYSLCQYNKTSNEATNLGNTNEISFTRYDGILVMLFTKTADSSVSTITLVCTPNDKTSLLYVPFTSDQKNLTLYSSHACLTKEPVPEPHGFFYILFVIIVTFAFAYLMIGMLVRFFLIGARGFEVIPNLDFWKKVQVSIWLAFVFVKNGCRVIPADNTYDSI